MGSRQFKVVQATHIFHMDQFEDVMDAEGDFPVRLLRVDHIRTFGEIHQDGITSVLLQRRIILVREIAPQAAYANPLAPFQFADERDAVEDLAVQVPRDDGCGIAPQVAPQGDDPGRLSLGQAGKQPLVEALEVAFWNAEWVLRPAEFCDSDFFLSHHCVNLCFSYVSGFLAFVLCLLDGALCKRFNPTGQKSCKFFEI